MSSNPTVTFRCPMCETANRCAPTVEDGTAEVACSECEWSHRGSAESGCAVCGCDDLWRQKDFPQSIGLLFVACGAILSSIAWAYHEPAWAIGILLAFAGLDIVLFALMPDVLVCYRCGARHSGIATSDDATYDHELGERYRQEAIRTKGRETGGRSQPGERGA